MISFYPNKSITHSKGKVAYASKALLLLDWGKKILIYCLVLFLGFLPKSVLSQCQAPPAISGTASVNVASTTQLSIPIPSGGTISTPAAGYKLHTFSTVGSTSFISTGWAPTVEILVVAGGGGGGNDNGGGGGAGGYNYNSAFSASSGTTSVTVGDKGAGQATNGSQGNSGGNSVFGTITSTGGGGGAGTGGTAGRAGGSGGGSLSSTGGATGGAGTQYAGGTGITSSNYAAGGGGGAGSLGGNYSGSSGSRTGGSGGTGLQNSISGTSTWYCSGGGGGSDVNGGTASNGGGAGRGGSNANATAATGYGCGGGGGSGNYGNGADGYQGVIYVKYPDPAVAGVWASDNTAVATVSSTGLVTGVTAGTANITYKYGNGTPCTQSTASTVPVTVTCSTAPGNPATYGSNQWNVYCYNAGDASGGSGAWTNAYSGYYQMSTSILSFDTRLGWANSNAYSWDQNTTPSSASGYSGCTVGNDYHSYTIKRQGFPCGNYTIDAVSDDISYLIIDGVQVWNSGGYTGENYVTGVWTGDLGASSTIEFKVSEGWGGSMEGLKFTNNSTQATNFTFSSITATTMTVGLTRGNGAAGVLIVATKSGDAITDPTPGVSYTGNAAYGSGTAVGLGYAIYSGNGASGNLVNLTGLLAGTTYNFTAYEYNASSCYTNSLVELTGSSTTLSSYKATFTAMSTGSANWCVGETRNVTVSVTNSGTSAWTDAAPDINIGVKWNADADYLVRVNAGGLAAGASATYTLTVTAPAAGANNLTFDVVNEGNCWFANNSNVCGSGNAVYQSPAITVNALPATPSAITGTTTVTCLANTTLSSSAAPAGGSSVWATSNSAVAVVSNSGSNTQTVSGAAGVAASSTATVSYYVTNSAGCNSASVNATVTVPGKPTAVTAVASPNPVCTNGTLTLTGAATNATSWAWVGPNSFSSTSQSPTLASPTTLAAGTYTLTATNACGSATYTTTAALVVTTLPTAAISYAGSPFCVSLGAGQAVTQTGTAGGTYSSTAGLTIVGATGAINPSTSTPGNYTVTYTIASASGCAQVTATTTVSIYALPAITGNPSSPAAINSGAGAGTFTVSATGGGLTYQWQQSTDGGTIYANISDNSIFSGCTTATLVVLNPPSSYNGYKYKCVVSGCAPSATSTAGTLTVVNSANANPCYGTVQNYNVDAAADADSYTWTFPSGWSVVSGETTRSVYVTVGINSGTVTATPINCSGTGTTPRWLAVTVASVNIAATTTTICSGGVATFSATPTNNGGGSPTYQWTKNGTDVSGETAATYSTTSLANTDAIAVRMTSGAGCVITSTSLNMLVNSNNDINSPAIAIGVLPANTACSGDVRTFTASGGNAAITPIYQWKLDGANVGTNSTSYAPTFTALSTTTHTVTMVMTSSSSCITGSPATSNAIEMTIYPTYTASAVITAVPAGTVCEGTSVTYSVTPSPAGSATYQWKNGASLVGTNSTTFTSTTLSNNDAITVVMTSGLPCTSPSPVVSNTINAAINLNISNNLISAAQVICSGAIPAALGNLSGAPTGGNGAYTYLWESSITDATSGFTTATGVSNAATYSPAALTQTTWYRRTVTSAPCAANTSTAIEITVNPAIGNNIIGVAQSICNGDTPASIGGSLPTGGNGIYTYSWDVSTTSAVAGFAPIVGATAQDYSPGALAVTTWYKRTVTSAPCTNSVSSVIAITVSNNLTPTVVISASPAAGSCNGSTVVYTPVVTNAGTSPTYQWKMGATDISGEVFSNYTTATIANGDKISVVMTPDVDHPACASASAVYSNTLTATVGDVPVATATNSAQTKCSGVAITTMVLATSPVVAGTTFAWTRDNTATATGVAASGTTDISGTFTNATTEPITVTFTIIPTGPGATACAGEAITATVVVNPVAPAVPGSIIGVANTYAGFTEPYSITAVPFATTYTWSVPGGWSISSGQGTNSIIAVAGTAGQNGNITVTAGNSCGTSVASAPLPVTVTANTAANTTPCQGTTQNYATQYRDNVSYRWTVPSDWTITAGGNSNAMTVVAGAATGSVTVTEYNSCGDGVVQNIVIAPNPRPAVTTTAGYACSGTALSIPFASSPAVPTTYSWIADDNASTSGESLTNQSGGTINDNIIINSGAIQTITYSVTPTVTATGCVGTAGGIAPQIVVATINPAGYWTGLANPDRSWFTVGNWCSVPTCGTDAFIPSSPVGNQFPVIDAAGANCRHLTISANASLDFTTFGLDVCGNWLNEGTFTPATGKAKFIGTANQNIGGVAANGFYDLEINNAGTLPANHVILTQPATVSNELTLTEGILMSSDSTLLTLTNAASTATTQGKATSYVCGPMRWNGINGAGPFVFPTGKGNAKWARIAIQDLTAATDFQAEYFNTGWTNVSPADLAATPTPVLFRVSGKEYWHFYRSGAGNGRVTLYWEDASWSGINSCATGGPLKIAHWDPSNATNSGGTLGSWENNNPRVTTAGSCGTSGSITTNVVVSEFSPFTFGDTLDGVNPLPVELLYFNAKFNGKNVDVNWQTASEINNDYFTVERSLDGIHFVSIGVVPSHANGGNSTSILSYYLNDDKVTPGVYYYRLKQTDFNGEYKYSNIDMVEIKGDADFVFSISPNPSDGTVLNTIISAEKGQEIVVVVHDILGQEIYSKIIITEQKGNAVYGMDLSQKLSSGVYMITATSNQKVYSKRLVVN
jgi:PKD-like domain/Bacterial Ig-like domain (group 2)/Secretion system C-terminal sorting domain